MLFNVQPTARSPLMLKFIFKIFSHRPRRQRNKKPKTHYTQRNSVPPLKPFRTAPKKTSVPAKQPDHANQSTLTGKCYVIDGDTIQIGNVRLRLAGIDAPELNHPWGQKAKWELVRMCKGQVITAEFEPELSYDRIVATCFLPDGRDLSAEMVKIGLALDWPKFSGGKYTPIEPAGARKRHWKAAARQRGHMSVFNK